MSDAVERVHTEIFVDDRPFGVDSINRQVNV